MTLRGARRILARIDAAGKAVDDSVIEALAYAGEYAVAGIRSGSMSNWIDRTGNLRSSVGYSISYKGQIVVQSGFEIVSEGANGQATGKQLSQDLAQRYSQYPFALIIVAGMNYAVYVEAIESKSVLAGGQLWIENNIGRIVEARVSQAINKFNQG